MADQQQPPAISAAFPAPPPFYHAFTASNLAQLKHLEDSSKSLPGSAESPSQTPEIAKRAFDLPTELRYLIPPTPPSNGQYRSFGEHRSTRPPPPSLPSETPSLIKSPPTPTTLTHLTRSILLNFFEYVHILATDPSGSEYGPKWDDIRDLLRNAHTAVNEYRPFQAREALIMMMEEEVERGRAEVRGMKALKDRVDGILAGLEKESEGMIDGEELIPGMAMKSGKHGGEGESLTTKKIASRGDTRMWEMMREEGIW